MRQRSANSADLVALLKEKGLTVLDEPIELASGHWSSYFIDGKLALAAGEDLRFAAEQIWARIAEEPGIEFDCVGGLTLGADPLAAAIAVVTGIDWFIVRKKPKGRGTNRLIEGTQIGPANRVLLVDDVVTTGGSILKAYKHVTETGASVAVAVTLVDRGDEAAESFKRLDVPYFPMATYSHLDIPRIGFENPCVTSSDDG